MNGIRLAPTAAAIIIAALAAAGCASSPSAANVAGATSGSSVDIYSSLPMQGSSSAQTIPMVNGIKLALSVAHDKAGKFTVKYIQLDDSTATAGKWDPTQTAANAREAATDPKAVYYIGEFNSGASEVSIPILNALKSTPSVLGTFGFDKDGDTTLNSYGVYRVAANGTPAFFETLTPAKVAG